MLAFPYCQQPLTSLLTISVSVRFLGSLMNNNLTNFGKDMSGIIQLAESLKTNEGLTSLKYAPALPQPCPIKQASAASDASSQLIPVVASI